MDSQFSLRKEEAVIASLRRDTQISRDRLEQSRTRQRQTLPGCFPPPPDPDHPARYPSPPNPVPLIDCSEKEKPKSGMRRLRGGGAAGSPEASARRGADGEPAHGLLPSAPSALKLVFVVALVTTLYTTLVVLREGGGGGGRSPVLQLRASSGRSELRSTFRQLSMMGFEEGDGLGGEWRTCRAYEEDKLAPHKKVKIESSCKTKQPAVEQ